MLLQALLAGFFYEFPHEVRQCTDSIVNAAVEIYFRMSSDLLPTPAKSHYVFNLRDLSKCIQGKWSYCVLRSHCYNLRRSISNV